MHYAFIAIPESDVPAAVEPIFQHIPQTYASETNKTVSVWRAVPDDYLDFKPHEKTNSIRTIMVHQLLSERRFGRDSMRALLEAIKESSLESRLQPVP